VLAVAWVPVYVFSGSEISLPTRATLIFFKVDEYKKRYAYFGCLLEWEFNSDCISELTLSSLGALEHVWSANTFVNFELCLIDLINLFFYIYLTVLNRCHRGNPKISQIKREQYWTMYVVYLTFFLLFKK
jgi:hypothetical protein